METAERLIQTGMRAALRDVMEYIEGHDDPLDAPRLKAYLLACLITAGAYDDLHDESEQQQPEALGDYVERLKLRAKLFGEWRRGEG